MTLEDLAAELETGAIPVGDDPLLKNRYDTKYIIPAQRLPEVLGRLDDGYRTSRYGNLAVQIYESLYFDDPALTFYHDHRRGKLGRRKIRLRFYPASGFACLEIKAKTNRRETSKRRRRVPPGQFEAGLLTEEDRLFLAQGLDGRDPASLMPTVRLRYARLTLQNKSGGERVTLDADLVYIDLRTGASRPGGDFVVAEVKQASRAVRSPFGRLMRELRLGPARFSKYCYGVYLSRPDERHNRLKPAYVALEKSARRPVIFEAGAACRDAAAPR